VLTPWETIYRASERNDNFRADSSVNTGSASLSDYKGSGYDRGHLIPYADLGWSEEAASESFYLSNMSPQAGDLNRYAWADLEAVVRTFSLSGPICVVTGPVLSDGPYETIGENKVSVPKYFYKVIYSPVLEAAIAFVLPNEKCDEPLENYAESVDYVENLTGIDFFSGLEEELENDLEGNIDVSVWDFTKYNSSVAKKYGYDTETGYKEGETEQTVAVNTQTEEIEDYYLLLQHYLYTYLWPAKQQIIVVVHSFGI
nr:DNA/RNA non-specific endonuclease [Sphaerochaetaceae bacterium]